MTIKEAIKELKNIDSYVLCHMSDEEEEALNIAIDALEEAQLDIKALKRDLPELFKPHYDGGYLKEGEEE